MKYTIDTLGKNNVISVYQDMITVDDKYYEYKMITGNNIPVFLSCKSRYENASEIIDYDITSKRSLESLSETTKLCFHEVLMLISSLKEAKSAIDEYLLSYEGLSLDPKFIFYDQKNKKIRFLFYPWKNTDLFTSYSMLSEFLLSFVDYDDEKAVTLVYKIYASVLNKDYDFESLVKDELDEFNKRIENQELKKEPLQTNYEDINRNQNDNINRNQDNHIERVSTHSTYRLSVLSVICITLFVTFSIMLVTMFAFNKGIFMYVMNKTSVISVFSAVMCILVFIPVANISEIKRIKRQDVHIQKTC